MYGCERTQNGAILSTSTKETSNGWFGVSKGLLLHSAGTLAAISLHRHGVCVCVGGREGGLVGVMRVMVAVGHLVVNGLEQRESTAKWLIGWNELNG